jgi:hypothetical protein
MRKPNAIHNPNFSLNFAPPMQAFKKSLVFRIFWLFMAIHIFNLSVDSRDARPYYEPEDLSINDLESVAEILLEQVLNINNAFAEHDESDCEDGGSIEIKKEILICNKFRFECIRFFKYNLRLMYSANYLEQYSSQFHPEIVPPPPKA